MAEWVNPETLHLAEDADALHLCLDKVNVPRSDESGKVFSLWGRVQRYSAQTRIPALTWVKDGDPHCRYDHWLAETPLGRIMVTWKGWKDHPTATVDEFPGDMPNFVGSPDEVKAQAEAEFFRRIRLCLGDD